MSQLGKENMADEEREREKREAQRNKMRADIAARKEQLRLQVCSVLFSLLSACYHCLLRLLQTFSWSFFFFLFLFFKFGDSAKL
jgi:hypothetical protein